MKGKRSASVPTSVFLTEELKRDMLAAGRYYGLSVSDIIRLAVREWLNNRPMKIVLSDATKEELTSARSQPAMRRRKAGGVSLKESS